MTGAVGPYLTVTDSMIDHNQARGGRADDSGPPSHGGDAHGGGVDVNWGSTLAMSFTSLSNNQVKKGAGEHGGNDGQVMGDDLFLRDPSV